MAEPSSTTNQRSAIYTVTKGEHRKATVSILEWEEGEKTARVMDTRSQAIFRKRMDSLERIFRTPRERELGRDFTVEEVAAYEREWALHLARILEHHNREDITNRIADIAAKLSRAVEELARLNGQDAVDPATKVERVQNELAWLIPNLGTHLLTSKAVAWTHSARDLKRVERQEPADEAPAS